MLLLELSAVAQIYVSANLVPWVLSPLTATPHGPGWSRVSQDMGSKIIINERGVRQYRFCLLTSRQNQSAPNAKYIGER